ncbi:hypothetical protein DCPSUM001_24130 [Dysgonomonas capnocytophagoides]|nr:hypothetical protein DCPSUM001_24130 [Dysgonomonas capnocytophagoides]
MTANTAIATNKIGIIYSGFNVNKQMQVQVLNDIFSIYNKLWLLYK